MKRNMPRYQCLQEVHLSMVGSAVLHRTPLVVPPGSIHMCSMGQGSFRPSRAVMLAYVVTILSSTFPTPYNAVHITISHVVGQAIFS